MNNLGKALDYLNRLKEAEVLFRQALERKENLLGPEHPHTLQSSEDLTNRTRKIYSKSDPGAIQP